jgi:hypothetical protein
MYSFQPFHGPGVDSTPSKNKYQEYFLEVKAAGTWGWQPHHLRVPNVMKILEPKSPGTLWDTPGLLRDCFTFTCRNCAPSGTHRACNGTALTSALITQFILHFQPVRHAVFLYDDTKYVSVLATTLALVMFTSDSHNRLAWKTTSLIVHSTRDPFTLLPLQRCRERTGWVGTFGELVMLTQLAAVIPWTCVTFTGTQWDKEN